MYYLLEYSSIALMPKKEDHRAQQKRGTASASIVGNKIPEDICSINKLFYKTLFSD